MNVATLRDLTSAVANLALGGGSTQHHTDIDELAAMLNDVHIAPAVLVTRTQEKYKELFQLYRAKIKTRTDLQRTAFSINMTVMQECSGNSYSLDKLQALSESIIQKSKLSKAEDIAFITSLVALSYDMYYMERFLCNPYTAALEEDADHAVKTKRGRVD